LACFATFGQRQIQPARITVTVRERDFRRRGPVPQPRSKSHFFCCGHSAWDEITGYRVSARGLAPRRSVKIAKRRGNTAASIARSTRQRGVAATKSFISGCDCPFMNVRHVPGAILASPPGSRIRVSRVSAALLQSVRRRRVGAGSCIGSRPCWG